MTDLVERLRTTRLLSQRNQMALQAEAAAEIGRLSASARANNDLARHETRARVELQAENARLRDENAALRDAADNVLNNRGSHASRSMLRRCLHTTLKEHPRNAD